MMLEFSSTQLSGFERHRDRDFVEDVVRLCRKHLPSVGATMSPEDLHNLVSTSIETAKEAGLRWQSNLASVSLLDLRYQCAVLHVPEIRRRLEQALTPDEAFRSLFDAQHAFDWRELDKVRA